MVEREGLTKAQQYLPALSIMQPWAWLIANRHKPVENRDWRTHFRGPFLIHAGKRIDREADEFLRDGRHPCTGLRLDLDLPETWETGGIVGKAEVYDCVTASDSEWFVGRFGLMLRGQAPVPFVPCKGALGFFRPNYDEAPVEARPVNATPRRKLLSPPPAVDDLFGAAGRAALSERGGR